MINYDPLSDRFIDECGVFGVFGHKDASFLTVLGLHALQHRGQEAAGIVSFDGNHFHAERHLGLVENHFSKDSVKQRIQGQHAIGHVRYSTRGKPILRNVQPLYAEFSSGGFSLAHNGNITNALTLREKLISNGAIFQSTSDTEVVLHLMGRSARGGTTSRFCDAVGHLEGAYALVALSEKKMLGVRDPYGIRPLVLGEIDGAFVLSSETCALDIIGANFIREVENGEVIVITKDGLESFFPFETKPFRPCIFEYIYFARPDSHMAGRSIYGSRQNMGEQLATESPCDIDLVIPVPDSGVPAAMGYARKLGKPFEMGIIRNHYVGRTFIKPSQNSRQDSVNIKHNANKMLIEGKKIVLIDDSLVRGTTSMKIVKMMREAGAKEVHMRISSPPIKHPDYYGINTPTHGELMAHKYDEAGICEYIGANSLKFLSLDGLYKAMGYQHRDNDNPQFTDHAFSGEYPTGLSDLKNKRFTSSEPRLDEKE